VIDLPFRGERVGALPLQLIEHALESFAQTSGTTLHLRASGRNDHHLAEAAFKAMARAMRSACEVDPRRDGIASTKGSLG
jgi:imidazoleglycerol-phosphate dehydratase